MTFRIVFIAACILVSGCAKTIPLTTEQFHHSLNVQVDGKPWFKATNPKKDNEIIEDFGEQLRVINNYKEYQTKDQVLIFVHGGLNRLGANQSRTTETIEAINSWNDTIGGTSGKTIYPVMINWHSRGWTWYDRMFRVRKGRINPTAAIVTSPFAILTDAGRTIGRLPAVYYDETTSMLSNTTHLGRKVNHPPSDWEDMENIHIEDRRESYTERWQYGLFQIFPGVLRSVTIPIADFALYESYQMMLRRIDMLFRTEADYDNAAKQKKTDNEGAIPQLMEMLIKDKKEIVLIGHSMGAIVVNEIVRRYPQANFTTIVYMAGACTTKDFLDTIPSYLENRNNDTKFYNLTLHPFADQDESTGFYLFPNGSLLEWLDTYVHRVKTPLDLTFGKWNNAVNVLPLLGSLPAHVKKRIFVKGFPFEENGFPVLHGDFGRFPYWDPDFWDPKYKKPFKPYR